MTPGPHSWHIVRSCLLYVPTGTPAVHSLAKMPTQAEDRTPAEQRSALRWAQRLKRVFKVDVETCPKCGGSVKIIASIEDPPVIERILNHPAARDSAGLVAESPASSAARGRLPH